MLTKSHLMKKQPKSRRGAMNISKAIAAVEALESRTLFSLLGVGTPALPFDPTYPQIIVGLQSATQNPPGPLAYNPSTELFSAVATYGVTLATSSSKPATISPCTATIYAYVDNNGNLISSLNTNSASLSVSGTVSIGSTKYTGTLLTGSIVEMGFTTTPGVVVPTFDFVFAPTGGSLDTQAYFASQDIGVTLTVQGSNSFNGNFDANFSAPFKGLMGPVAPPVIVPTYPPLLLYTTPNLTALTFSNTAPSVLADTADLVGGNTPTGSIAFTLIAPNGTTVATQNVAVNGDGLYSAPGYTLPTAGALTGTYQWDATYSGDSNNGSISDNTNPDEQTVVTPASPAITTTPSSTLLTLGSGPQTLTDSATLSGAYNPTGTITFTLYKGTTLVDTETATVNSDGTYTTPTGYTLPTVGTVTGTYQWDATYSGDSNNNSVSDNNNANEQVTVNKAASATSTAIDDAATNGAPTGALGESVYDTATVVGNPITPTGTLTYYFYDTASPIYGSTTPASTQVVTLVGGAVPNSSPSAALTAGSYSYIGVYSGDGNYNGFVGAVEPLTINKGTLTLSTTIDDAATNGTPSGALGESVYDTSVLNGSQPFPFTGTVTYTFNGNSAGSGAQSTTEGPLAAAGYTFEASSTGDSNYNVIASSSESLTISPAQLSISTSIQDASGGTPSGSLGESVIDTATVGGQVAGFAIGNISYTFQTGGGTPVSAGSGATSTTEGLLAAGGYNFQASVAGNSNYIGATSAPEPLTINKGTLTLSTTIDDAATNGAPTGAPGESVYDTYSLSGSQPFPFAGTVNYTFNGNSAGGGSQSSIEGPLSAGNYSFQASSTGDSNYTVNPSAAEALTINVASPAITTTPSATGVTLGISTVTLKDTAVLSGGYNPTGTITFTLYDGSTLVDTETATAVGNGSYSTPTGYTLPTAGTVTGVYQWDATYGGDANNNSISDNNASNELVTVTPASPAIVTTASPSVTLGATAPTLSDSAVVSGGYYETGNLVFTLSGPGGFSYTQNDSLTGNGTYAASDTLPTAGTVAGTYTWSVKYIGDGNNNGAVDQGGTAEQTAVGPASPTIATTPGGTVLLGSGARLTDSAILTGGYDQTGTATFTLYNSGTPVYTDTVTVSGNTFSSASGNNPGGYLPAAAGTYKWTVSYSGDANNNPVASPIGNEPETVTPASPAINTTPGGTVTQGSGAPLTDTAILSQGYNPSGTITFVLSAPNGNTVDTETVSVNGNGTYSTPNGYTLPAAGAATGTYTWFASYSGDGNNNASTESGGVIGAGSGENENVIPASPTIVTTASSAATLGTTAPTLSDSAVVAGGYNETGNLVFTLSGPGGFSFTQSDTLAGNGTYTASDTLPTTGPVAGTYTWSVNYAGDVNNNGAVDQGGIAEQTAVSKAGPAIVTTASSALALGTTAPTLSDSAVVSGGYYETGSLVFTLSGPGGFSYSQSDTLSGNGTYTASDTLPTTGTVAGTYTWSVNYAGDVNSNGAVDQGGLAEQTVVSKAGPAIVTTASSALTLGTTAPTLSDSAVVSGGYYETGSLAFTLKSGATTIYTTADALTGNGTYAATYSLPTTGTVAGSYTWSVSYIGDANNKAAVDQGGTGEQTVVSKASPTIVTTAGPAVTLGTTAPTLSDSAVVSNGYFETGSLAFTLKLGASTVYTTSDALLGNGTYTASYTLPVTGTAAGIYTWSVSYVGDGNNYGAVDQGGTTEQTVVSKAGPKIVTTAGAAVTLGTTAPTLGDSAVVSGGYYETGSLVFALNGPNGFSYTQTDTLSGNGTYTASDTLPTTGTVAGTYTWHVSYAGDVNNNSANDQGGTAEQTVVSKAGPAIVTTANSAVTLGTTAPILSDSAVVSGGYNNTGSLVFTLSGPGGFSYTQSDTLAGNGTYIASDTLPTTGTVAGTYTWHVSYAGDVNNNSAVDQGGTTEQTAVSPASPTIATTPSTTSVTLGASSVVLKDTAALSGGYYETGTITFTLYNPSSGLVDTESVTVNGNGSYATPTGYTLAANAAAGTYQWDASFASGNANNIAASDNNDVKERVVVSASPITICGTKFLDLTGNGFSSDDTGLGGVTIDLYKESNGTAGLQTGCGGDTLVATAVTASNGTYSFANLTAGATYYVQEVVPCGYIQTGGGPNGCASDSYYTITAATGQTYSGNNFDDYYENCTMCSLSNIYYVIDGCKTVTELSGNVQPGDIVTVYFTAAANTNELITLVSYTAPDSSFNASDAYEQVIYDDASVQVSGSASQTYSLTVQIPTTDYQIDFICGPAINTFGPACSNIFYHAQNRIFDSSNGGAVAPVAGGSDISGIVYCDANVDGLLDSGDSVLAGATLTLTGKTTGGTTVTQTTTSATNGSYSFVNLAAGTYTVTETTPAAGHLVEINQPTSYTLTLPANVTSTNPMGNVVMVNFAEVGSGNIDGFAWDDCNGDGKVDWNEAGICGVSIMLSGVDCFGHAVSFQTTTDDCGEYFFSNLLPGTYTVKEGQPSGFNQGKNSCGTINGAQCGSLSGTDTEGGIQLAACGQNAINYDFGEQDTTGVCHGADANAAFWKSTNGQNLLQSLNGGGTSTALSAWLSTTFANMYGTAAVSLNGMTNAQIGNFFITKDFNLTTLAAKVNTAVLATAFNCYATSSDLAGGTMAAAYGFNVTAQGSGYDTVNVGSNGAAFGVANNTTISILQALNATNAQAVNGILYNGNTTLQNEALTTYTSIDSTGGITC
jgi:hypothetical protein